MTVLEWGGAIALVHGLPASRTWNEPTLPSHLSSSPAPVPEVRTCHLCLLEDPSAGCISGSEKCTISTPSPCMVITIYYGESSPRKGLLVG